MEIMSQQMEELRKLRSQVGEVRISGVKFERYNTNLI